MWLIPGHIGHRQDLGCRALRVLRTIDIMYIEEGGTRSIEHIYDVFGLGPIPEVVDISTEPGVMEGILEAAHAEGKTMALFGNDEGAPGLCDPGWRVLQAEQNIEPNLVIKSISAGSALATALMYLDRPQSEFIFLGTFETDSDVSPFFKVLERCKSGPVSPSLICFSGGTELNDQWEIFRKALSGLECKITLLINLSKRNECRHQISAEDISGMSGDFIKPDDKVVLRIDFDERKGGGTFFYGRDFHQKKQRYLSLPTLGAAWFGFLLAWFGLARLLNLDFLRLDWVLQPDLDHWGPHMMNLIMVVVGLMLMTASARWLNRILQ